MQFFGNCTHSCMHIGRTLGDGKIKVAFENRCITFNDKAYIEVVRPCHDNQHVGAREQSKKIPDNDDDDDEQNNNRKTTSSTFIMLSWLACTIGSMPPPQNPVWCYGPAPPTLGLWMMWDVSKRDATHRGPTRFEWLVWAGIRWIRSAKDQPRH